MTAASRSRSRRRSPSTSSIPPPYVDLAVERDGTAWIVWDDRRTKDRKVRLARAKDGKLEQLSEPLGDGRDARDRQ